MLVFHERIKINKGVNKDIIMIRLVEEHDILKLKMKGCNFLYSKMNNYHTVGTIPKFNIKS